MNIRCSKECVDSWELCVANRIVTSSNIFLNGTRKPAYNWGIFSLPNGLCNLSNCREIAGGSNWET